MAQKTQLTKASRIALAVALVVFAVVEAYFVATTHAGPPFAGNWRLVSFVTVGDDGVATPSRYTDGRIMYDAAGHMAAQLTFANRPPLAPEATEAERAVAQASYLAYYGTYQVDAQAAKVTHHVQGSTNPNWPRTDLVRYYEFADDGDTLRLSLRNDAGRTTGTLTWARIH